MNTSNSKTLEHDNKRILIIDDNKAIHDDFKKILCVDNQQQDHLDELESNLFSQAKPTSTNQNFELSFALQGEEALGLVESAIKEGKPFAMAFVDIRMPPGWDGVETIQHLWEKDPNLQTIICSAYSDYSWHDITQKLGHNDKLLILKKPFDSIEVLQMAWAMVSKWNLAKQAHLKMESLEQAVQSRTHKIEEKNALLKNNIEELNATRSQLVHSEKLSSIGQLAAGVAHEINNPIRFISGNIEVLKEYCQEISNTMLDYLSLESDLIKGQKNGLIERCKQLKSKRESVKLMDILSDLDKLIDDSLSGSMRIQNIVNDLKSFSRVDSKKASKVDLIEQVIDPALRLAANHIKYKCRVNKSLSPLPLYTGHPGELSQVIMNLVVNASDAIESQGDITINSDVIDSHIQIDISDSGSGIDPSHLSKIFDPFFTTKEPGKGTGLGLSISHGIIQKYAGELNVHSQQGKGTTFSIRLPIPSVMEKHIQEDSHEG
jgi:signal transduction histidine kinase